jgi:hypothetical protein
MPDNAEAGIGVLALEPPFIWPMATARAKGIQEIAAVAGKCDYYDEVVSLFNLIICP